MTQPTFRALRGPEEIEELTQEWDALVASAARPSPYLLASWVADWVREFDDEFEPCITVAERGLRLVGIAPFVLRRGGHARVAQFVGADESSLADLLVAPDEPSATAETLLESLPLAGAEALNGYGLPGDSVLERTAGKRLRTIPRVSAPVLEMPDGWEAAYERRVPGPRRSKHRAAERRLAREGVAGDRRRRRSGERGSPSRRGLRDSRPALAGPPGRIDVRPPGAERVHARRDREARGRRALRHLPAAPERPRHRVRILALRSARPRTGTAPRTTPHSHASGPA